MHFSSTFVLAALPFLALAKQPLKNRQTTTAYNLVAIHSGDQAVHNQPIVAANESFYIGAQSSASCPAGNSVGCQGQTQITLDNSQAALQVTVPGGQQVFLTSTGALAYTAPHSRTIPSGAQETGFATDASSSDQPGSTSNLIFNGSGSFAGWLACPSELNNMVDYQIFANITGVQVSGSNIVHCHDIAIALEPANASASAFQFD